MSERCTRAKSEHLRHLQSRTRVIQSSHTNIPFRSAARESLSERGEMKCFVREAPDGPRKWGESGRTSASIENAMRVHQTQWQEDKDVVTCLYSVQI